MHIKEKIKMKLIQIFLVSFFIFTATSAYAEKITIAAASDLKFAMDDVVKLFKKDHPADEIEVIFGSSGKTFTQIQQGAPYDIFFSADISYPQELADKGFASSKIKLYAIGRIVLWSTVKDASKMTLGSLIDPSLTHIAIANPKHAPYGKRAEEALRKIKIWDKIESKLVYGENIAQAAQFVQTGNAQIGIIALSLAVNPEFTSKGGYFLIPSNLHNPLEQAYIITKRAEKNLLAKKFADFMEDKSVRSIMIKYGFLLPNEMKQK